MTKYIKILFSFLLVLTLSSCRDDFEWHGIEVGEDEYLLSFTTSTPNMEIMGSTRAGDSRDDIKNLTLVIFKDGILWDKPLYFPDNDKKLSYISPSKDEDGKVVPGSITMPKSAITSGDWYLFANAQSEIRSFMSSKDNGDEISKGDLLSGISYGTTEGIHGSDQLDSENPHVMWGMEPITIGDRDASQSNAVIIGLARIYSRVSVEVSGDIKFKMTGARLNKWVTPGTLEGKQVSDVIGTVSDTEGWIEPEEGMTNDSPYFKYAKSGERLIASTYPYKLNNEAVNDAKMMMLVKGRFNDGTLHEPEYDSSDCFYAIPVPSCPRNGGWRIIITGALAAGQTTPEGAIEHPGGLSVVFEDSEPKIHNIVSDGENVLAVVDSVKFNADGTLDGATGTVGTVLIKARQKGTPTTPDVSFTSGTYDWITWQGSEWTSTPVSSDVDNGLFTHEFKRELKVSKNSGSERSATFTVKLGETGLTRNFVIYQKAPENLNYSSIVSIKLTITGGASPATINDYIKFINPKGTTNTNANDPECKGIQPDENGGRVRNLGLHMPMPNGGNVTYKYVITAASGGQIYKKGESEPIGPTLTWEYKDTDIPIGETSKYAYVTNSDAYYIQVDGNKYSLDLYHTGFFHKHPDGWHYYEVMQQGDRDLYWLDRNLKASSAGMGVRTSNGVMTSTTWPIVGDKALGEYYNLSDAESDKPNGWDVPTYAQMRSMTVSSSFTINRKSNPSDHKTYLAPTFTYQGKEDGEVKSFSSYFPQSRLKVGGSVGGDAEAGYYLTKTPAGTSGWYQTMQFEGMNVTSQNLNYNINMTEASVRCCAGNYDPQADATTYSCNVKGYTHVFLYYMNSDGSKTYLTTWPGEQVAVYQSEESNDIGRFHPFEIEPTMSYNKERLFVIFNTVNTKGEWVDSNMSNDDVKNRKGTKFVNGGSYDKDADPKLTDVKEGNWVTNSNTDLSGKSVYLKGDFDTWGDGFKASTNSQGIAKFEAVEIGTNSFKVYVSSESKWYSTNASVAADENWHTVPENSEYEQNMTISGATAGAKYDVEWDYTNHKIKIKKITAQTYKYIIRGNIWENWSSGGWTNNTNTTINGSKTYYTNIKLKPGSFGVAKYASDKLPNNNSTTEGHDEWLSATNSTDAEFDIDKAVNSYKTIALSSAGSNNMSITSGTYDIEIDHSDPSNVKLTITRKVAVTLSGLAYGIRGQLFDGGNWTTALMNDPTGTGKWELKYVAVKGKKEFGIGGYTKDTDFQDDNNQKEWWGSSSSSVTLGSPKTLYKDTGQGKLQLDSDGVYNFLFDEVANTLTVTKITDSGSPQEYVKIFGNFSGAGGPLNKVETSKSIMTRSSDNNLYKFTFTTTKAGDIYFRLIVNGTEMGPDWNNGYDTTLPVGSVSNSNPTPIDVSNKDNKKAYKATLEANKNYEVQYYKEWSGSVKVGIYKLN